MDPDTDRLQLAKGKYSAPNLTYQEGKAEDISGGNYDVVFSNFVLHWCEDKDIVFKQVMRSLKEGGKFGFVCSNFNVAEQFCTPGMLSVESREHIINATHIPSTEDIHKLIEANGFQVAYLHEHICEWKFDSVSKLIEFFMTHYSEYGRHHYNADAMKKQYGDGEIVFKMPCTTAILVKAHT